MAESVKYLLDWPVRHAYQVKRYPLLESRLLSIVRYGIIMSSDFSGQLSAETAMKMTFRGLSKVKPELGGDDPVDESLISCYSACDVAEESRKVIATSCTQHLFPEILAQLPPEMAEQIKALRPTTHVGPNTKHYKKLGTGEKLQKTKAPKRKRLNTELDGNNPDFANDKDPAGASGSGMPKPNIADAASAKQAAAKAYDAQAQFIKTHKAEVYPDGRKGPCLLCNKLCAVRAPLQDLMGRGANAIRWNVSGPECTPYSPMGRRTGGAHAAMESWHCWVNGVFNERDFEMITIENSSDMPSE
eukprot:8351038-Alexandrium_andersonii.AAC.1